MNTVSTVDEYLQQLPQKEKKELQRIREIIFTTIPDVKERIAYKICIFSVNKDMVGFASQKKHLSFYTMSPLLVKKMNQDFKGYQLSGATIHFSEEKPLPTILIQKILKERYKEIKQFPG